MIILGIGKPIKDDQGNVTSKTYIVELTEGEFDQVTGIAGRPHIASRYKPGRDVNLADVYQRVKYLNEKEAEIKVAANNTIANANDILNAFPIER